MANTSANNISIRLIRHYKYFFLFGIFILLIQFFIAYKSLNLPIFNSNDYISFIKKQNSNKLKNNIEINKIIESSNIENHIIDDEDVQSNSDNNFLSNKQIKPKLEKKLANELKLNFIPKCQIQSKDSISAITRAKTDSCKQLIVNISCDIQNNVFYPKSLTNYCPHNNIHKTNNLVGCYQDDNQNRLLSGYYINFKLNNSPERCVQICLQSGYKYAGVEYSTECFCGNIAPPVSSKLPDPKCNMKCSDDPKKACGGYFTANVYETGVERYTLEAKLQSSNSKEVPVRIAFLLTLNGRALRQVHRLLRSLYSSEHFYYIHIDSRQDYLYRELLSLEEKYENIRLARKRFSTIWGGGSLLTMLLSSMEHLVKNSNWEWDFVINLSESDFPVKAIDTLVNFLTANRDKNFVKSHGHEVQRFIQKQGIDKTFVECDTHMWRIGDRVLPAGIQIDGGSDWVALSRDFVTYLTQDHPNDLVEGLILVYKHTLLPAESFFHTVLRNSEFCRTYIDNNLHVTNWKRKLGCKCQYKHIVDWCGCSPNDFLTDDWPRLHATESKQLYFARKFEAIINQNIVLQLEEWIFGPYPSDVLHLNNYWQSLYHHKDESPVPDDSLLTIATSLIRINSVSFNYIPKNILELTSFLENDQYKGFIITHNGSFSSVNIENTVLFETLVKPVQVAKTSISSELGKRIRSLEVSSEFDQKEQIARNYAKILGPNSEPVLVFRLAAKLSNPDDVNTPNNEVKINLVILWIDPTGNLVSTDEYRLEDPSGSSINFVKTTLRPPLTPGIWTTKIVHNQHVIASCRFLITPLQFVSQQEITQKQAEKLNYGIRYENDNRPEYSKFIISEEDRNMFREKSLIDSKQIGFELQSWIDNLVSNFYTIKNTCVHITADHKKTLDGRLINKYEKCVNTSWSTFAIDTKSDLSDLNKT